MAHVEEEAANISAAVVDSSPSAIIAVDLDGEIIGWNPAAEQLTGFSAGEALGAPVLSIMPRDERPLAARIMSRVRKGETVCNREVRRLRRDGSTFIGNLTVAPIRCADGEISGTVGIMHDVTGTKAMDELLRRNQRLASVGTLAAGIAHEINNPVGGILMASQYARTVLGREDAEAVIVKALEDIEADAKRCSEIVRGLLRLARDERCERTENDLGDVIEAAIDIAARLQPGASARVEFSRRAGVPPATIDAADIEQALVNIITNALQAGSSHVTIEVRADDRAGTANIIVADDGSGIGDDIIDHLFDPFFTTRRARGGAGLGLSVAHAIASDHQGSLEVSSSNEGTTVTMTLPLPSQARM
jgi:PAS domain S-box-containing protein